MRRVVLVTSGYWKTKYRLGFHWLAEALWRAGWDVTFMTVSISWLTRLLSRKRDRRGVPPILEETNQVVEVKQRLRSYVHYTPWHPVDLRSSLLNRLSAPLIRLYGKWPFGHEVVEILSNADLLILDSTPGLLSWPSMKRLNPRARMVYRVSDDLRYMKPMHPAV